MVNFAKHVVCRSCKRHVDKDTRHLNNRLHELKNERFAREFKNDESRTMQNAAALAAAAAAEATTAGEGQRADGSCAKAAPSQRASFRQI